MKICNFLIIFFLFTHPIYAQLSFQQSTEKDPDPDTFFYADYLMIPTSSVQGSDAPVQGNSSIIIQDYGYELNISLPYDLSFSHNQTHRVLKYRGFESFTDQESLDFLTKSDLSRNLYETGISLEIEFSIKQSTLAMAATTFINSDQKDLSAEDYGSGFQLTYTHDTSILATSSWYVELTFANILGQSVFLPSIGYFQETAESRWNIDIDLPYNWELSLFVLPELSLHWQGSLQEERVYRLSDSGRVPSTILEFTSVNSDIIARYHWSGLAIAGFGVGIITNREVILHDQNYDKTVAKFSLENQTTYTILIAIGTEEFFEI